MVVVLCLATVPVRSCHPTVVQIMEILSFMPPTFFPTRIIQSLYQLQPLFIVIKYNPSRSTQFNNDHQEVQCHVTVVDAQVYM